MNQKKKRKVRLIGKAAVWVYTEFRAFHGGWRKTARLRAHPKKSDLSGKCKSTSHIFRPRSGRRYQILWHLQRYKTIERIWELHGNERAPGECRVVLHLRISACSSKLGFRNTSLKNHTALMAQRNGRNANPAVKYSFDWADMKHLNINITVIVFSTEDEFSISFHSINVHFDSSGICFCFGFSK